MGKKLEMLNDDWVYSRKMPHGDRRNIWLDMEKYRNRKEKFINWLIKKLKVDTNLISDGYHTFEELYDHRISLWIAICNKHNNSWKSKVHSDGSIWKGWFLLGVNYEDGEQMTYHIPNKYWKKCKDIRTESKAPKWDGHSPKEVIKRLNSLWD